MTKITTNKLSDINLTEIFSTTTIRKVGKGRGHINLHDFMINKKNLSDMERHFAGMYCEDDIVVASDTQLFVAIKASYDDKCEGKIVAKDGTIIPDCKFPHWKSIVPVQGEMIGNLEGLIAATNEANATLKMYKSCNKPGGKSIEEFKDWGDWSAWGNCKCNKEKIYIKITLHGVAHYFNLKQANAIINVANYFNEPVVYYCRGELVIVDYGLIIMCIESYIYDESDYPIFYCPQTHSDY